MADKPHVDEMLALADGLYEFATELAADRHYQKAALCRGAGAVLRAIVDAEAEARRFREQVGHYHTGYRIGKKIAEQGQGIDEVRRQVETVPSPHGQAGVVMGALPVFQD